MQTKDEKYKLVIYADDIVILLTSTASFHFTELAKTPINDIMNWCDTHHLDLSIEKCCFTVFKLGKNISHIPRIKIKDINIKYTK